MAQKLPFSVSKLTRTGFVLKSLLINKVGIYVQNKALPAVFLNYVLV